MAIETTRFIKKPLYVEAVRITAANFDEVVSWCQGEVDQEEVPGKGTTKKFIKIRVLNPSPKNARQTKAFIGDWILYTERGYKIYTHKAFIASFDEALENVEDTEEPLTSFPVYNLLDQVRQLQNVGYSEQQIADQLGLNINILRLIEDNGRTSNQSADSTGINRSNVANVEDVPQQESIVPAAAEGKRVLSIAEQDELTAHQVRDLVQSGEAVLVQDLPEKPSGRPSWTNGLD